MCEKKKKKKKKKRPWLELDHRVHFLEHQLYLY